MEPGSHVPGTPGGLAGLCGVPDPLSPGPWLGPGAEHPQWEAGPPEARRRDGRSLALPPAAWETLGLPRDAPVSPHGASRSLGRCRVC